MNLNSLVNQRQFIAKEEKLSGRCQQNDPNEQNLKPFQQTDDHQQPATETAQEHPTITDTILER
jgi:hypothetical protein